MSSLLAGKNILIMGLRNKWSIAWGIAKAARDQGANLIFTYLGEREKDAVAELAASLDSSAIYSCDVTSDNAIDHLFTALKQNYGVLHGVVHSIAFARAEDIQNGVVNTTRDGYALAMDISAYSLAAVAKRAQSLMTQGGSIITLTYMGSEKVFPGYNIMGVAKAALETEVRYLASDLGPQGIRVNAISAGPIKTLSAKGVKDFSSILDTADQKAPLRRRIDHEDIGGPAVFLLSELSRAVTGEIMHVDCGLNIMGI
ncbi:enoyl-ACP reductase [Dehalobacter sp. DCM]|uniref:enoyl-ACP reductase FabI n=1 Tax=Dehalobacter sp. DCM TaxID=2907827 RepID=UPI003081C96E|nr:enoyl-ACP reductase [Dehalobacter sp. DCM]